MTTSISMLFIFVAPLWIIFPTVGCVTMKCFKRRDHQSPALHVRYGRLHELHLTESRVSCNDDARLVLGPPRPQAHAEALRRRRGSSSAHGLLFELKPLVAAARVPALLRASPCSEARRLCKEAKAHARVGLPMKGASSDDGRRCAVRGRKGPSLSHVVHGTSGGLEHAKASRRS